jgi:hypothetical protein
MKISNAIARLEKFKAENGDVEICFAGVTEDGFDFTLCDDFEISKEFADHKYTMAGKD